MNRYVTEDALRELGRLIVKGGGPRRDGGRQNLGMALQTYLVNLRARHHVRVGRTVRIVTRNAALFLYRGMLKHKRPSRIDMALCADPAL